MDKNHRTCIGMCNWPNLILLRTQKPLENKQALTVKGILLFTKQNDNYTASNCREYTELKRYY